MNAFKAEESEARRAIIREWDDWARNNPQILTAPRAACCFLSISNKTNQSYSTSVRLAISGKQYMAGCGVRAA
jgi:hypothetical protein